MNYREFVSDIFNRLSPSQKHELFYFSLFDPSSWEEGVRYPILKEFKEELDERVVDLAKRVNPKFYRKITKSGVRKTKFLITFIYTGDLCCFMLAAALNEKKIVARTRKFGFPDLVVMVRGEEKAGVEIKRLISCASLKGRIDDEIVKPLNDGVWEKDNKLLFLFPQLGDEDPSRIQQIIKGYYFLEDYINERTGVETRLLCKYVEKKHHESSQYSFDGLIDKLSKWLI